MIVKKDTQNFQMLKWLDKYMIGHKGFIAGGCFKNIFNKEKIKDIDIFFDSENDFEEAVEEFDDDKTFSFYYENDRVKAYKDNETGLQIELCRAVFNTPDKVISNFDFTISKFAYCKVVIEDESGEELKSDDIHKSNTHIEYRVFYYEDFFEHLVFKRLVIDSEVPFPMSTFERMIRYIKYGYMPCKETKLKIANALNKLLPEQIQASESLYAGLD